MARKRLTDEQQTRLERAYLQHILIYLASGETSTTFLRTLVDNWYGYHRGGPFLKSTGTPHWFNRVKPEDHLSLGPALRAMDFISVEAKHALKSGAQIILNKDHAVPVAILRDMLTAQKPSSEDEVRDFLLGWYRVGVITKKEHDRLRQAKCQSRMPAGWDGKSRFARYLHCRIPQAGGCRLIEEGF